MPDGVYMEARVKAIAGASALIQPVGQHGALVVFLPSLDAATTDSRLAWSRELIGQATVSLYIRQSVGLACVAEPWIDGKPLLAQVRLADAATTYPWTAVRASVLGTSPPSSPLVVVSQIIQGITGIILVTAVLLVIGWRRRQMPAPEGQEGGKRGLFRRFGRLFRGTLGLGRDSFRPIPPPPPAPKK